MDRLEAMSTLVAAVDAGSLSKAARRSGVPLATVSRRVAQLEEHLGTRILNRSGRQLTLTDAGHAYLLACKRILEQVNEAERAATGEYSSPKGELIVTAPLVFGRTHALPVVVEFLQAFPEINVRLVLSDRISNLLEDHVDAAIRVSELPNSSLIATRLGFIQRVVCASPTYLALRGTPETPAALSHHDCITFEGLSSAETWSFKELKKDVRVGVHSRLVVNTAEAAVDASIAGLGITQVLSYQAARAESEGRLVRVLQLYESAPTPVNILYSGQGPLPLKLRAFLDFVAPRIKAKLALAATTEAVAR